MTTKTIETCDFCRVKPATIRVASKCVPGGRSEGVDGRTLRSLGTAPIATTRSSSNETIRCRGAAEPARGAAQVSPGPVDHERQSAEADGLAAVIMKRDAEMPGLAAALVRALIKRLPLDDALGLGVGQRPKPESPQAGVGADGKPVAV